MISVAHSAIVRKSKKAVEPPCLPDDLYVGTTSSHTGGHRMRVHKMRLSCCKTRLTDNGEQTSTHCNGIGEAFTHETAGAVGGHECRPASTGAEVRFVDSVVLRACGKWEGTRNMERDDSPSGRSGTGHGVWAAWAWLARLGCVE
jgi:hypothetical protein